MKNYLDLGSDSKACYNRRGHNFLGGSTITLIKSKGGLIAGSQKHYELWVQGGNNNNNRPKRSSIDRQDHKRS